MLAEYPRRGQLFLTMNNRGHDCVAEAYRNGRVEYVGGSIETLEESLLDIEAMLRLVAEDICPGLPVYLQGHSYGCDKVVFASNRLSHALAGRILLSPADSSALIERWQRAAADSVLTPRAETESIILDLTLLGIENHYPVPVVPDSFDCDLQRGGYEIFSTSKAPKTHAAAPNTLTLVGTLDPLQTRTTNEWRQWWFGENAEVVEVSGGDHHFHGMESSVTNIILNWIERHDRQG